MTPSPSAPRPAAKKPAQVKVVHAQPEGYAGAWSSNGLYSAGRRLIVDPTNEEEKMA